MKLFHYNFDKSKFIPEDLYNRVWAESEKDPKSFWESDVHEELEDYLEEDVVEINRSGD